MVEYSNTQEYNQSTKKIQKEYKGGYFLEVKTFYKSQKEVAGALNNIIDQYYKNIINESSLKKLTLSIIRNNYRKVYKSNRYTTVISQRCGKRRLELLERIITKECGGVQFEKLI